MLTIIKLNCEFGEIKGCQDCPFYDFYEELDEHKEPMFCGDFVCKLTNSSLYLKNGEWIEDDFKFNDCPIISIEKKAE